MTTVYFADFVGKKLLKKEKVGEEQETIPDMPEQSVLDKLSYFSELVGNGAVAVKLNANFPGVEVPSKMKMSALTINFSHTFTPNDLKYDELGITQTLSFKGQMHAVKIPWQAVNYIGWMHGGSARQWEPEKPPKVISFAYSQAKAEEPEPDPPPLVA